tara:strand:+ start:69 stop:833 length:765 start_codon:yes stop_codon:yes gene_type:complete
MALYQDRVGSPDPFIHVQDQALSPEFCKEVINRFEKDERRSAGVSGSDSQVQTIKQSNDLHISSAEGWGDLNDEFYNSLTRALPEYLRHIHSHYQLPCYDDNDMYDWAEFSPLFGNDVWDKGYQVQKTKPTDFYDWHDDMMVHWEEQSERTITFLWYLNDIHEGGCTEFMNGFKVPPRAGRLLLFPSTWTYMHRGGRLLGRTDKYICTGWVCRSPVSPQQPDLEPETLEEAEDIEGSLLDFEPPEITLDETILQ